jgi:probable F420-dependent oxidoreductase
MVFDIASGGKVRAMRFGAVMVESPARAEDWHARVRQVDELGFDVLLLPDHLGVMSPFPPLVAAAGISDRLRLGVQVCNVNFWNPGLLARDAATVDLLSDGRFELGLGAGHAQEEFAALGIPYERPGRRVALLEAAVPVLRDLLAGRTVTVDQPLPMASCDLDLPRAQPTVPIMVGGNGDHVLRIAATSADIVGLVGFTSGTGRYHTDLSHFTWTGLGERIDHVRRAAGARFDALELSVLVQRVVVTDDRRAAIAEFIGDAPVPVDVVADSPFALMGSVDHIAEQLTRLRDEHGVTYVTTFEPSTAALAGAMARLR